MYNGLHDVDPSGRFAFLPFLFSALAAALKAAAVGAAIRAAVNGTTAAFTGGNIGQAAWFGAVAGAVDGAVGRSGSFVLSRVVEASGMSAVLAKDAVVVAAGAAYEGANQTLHGGSAFGGLTLGARAETVSYATVR